MDTSDSGSDKIYVNTYVHVIRRDDNSGGLSDKQVNQAIALLNRDFAPHNIELLLNCNTIDIPDSQQFNNELGSNSILSVGNHDDAIDIYLYPQLAAQITEGRGSVLTIPDRELFVAGNYWRPPFPAMFETSVLTHEMGHAFGLYHTHHSGVGVERELIDGSNCAIAADRICDTPADPNLSHDVDRNTCSWITPITDPFGVEYKPDTLNYMSYSQVMCYERFTAQQANVMRNYLKADTFVSRVVFSFDHLQKTVTSNEIWGSGTITIGNKVVVENGGVLTIAAGTVVKFAPEGRLVIKKGGRVKLQGTLTSFCSNTWQGVEIEGDPFAVQSPSNQGMFVSSNGAVVENAKFGIRGWGGVANTTTGGIVSCTNTTFRNNEIAVALRRYPHVDSDLSENTPYKATFTLCSFVTDDLWSHEGGLKSFLNLLDVTGVKIMGCSFRNNVYPSTTSSDAFGYGVFSSNSSVFVTNYCSSGDFPCTKTETANSFRGLSYGVYMDVLDGDMSFPSLIDGAEFNGNLFGIWARGYDGLTVTDCEFRLGNLPNTSLTTEQVGIVLEQVSVPFTVSLNRFIGSQGNATKYGGIQSTNTGTLMKSIKENSFTDLTHGNTIFGGNGSSLPGQGDMGLVFECNQNSRNTFFDIVVDDHPQLDDLLRINQRRLVDLQFGTFEATGNLFTATLASNRNFINNGIDSVNYYYGTSAREQPITTNNSVYTFSASNNTGCSGAFVPCRPPCFDNQGIEDWKSRYAKSDSGYQSEIALYSFNVVNNDSTGALSALDRAAVHRQVRDSAAWMVWTHLALDTVTFHRDSVIKWFGLHDSYFTDTRMAIALFADGLSSQSLDLLDTIRANRSLSVQEIDDLNNLEDIINLLNGRSIDQLTKSVQDSLEVYATNYTGFASTWARNVLTSYGYHFKPEYNLPDPQFTFNKTAPSPNGQIEVSELLDQDVLLTVYPNPAQSTVTIECDGISCSDHDLSIVEVLGREVFTARSAFIETNTLQVDLTNEGIYYVILRNDAGLPVLSRSLVISR